jgi:hypothetical protein
MDDRAIRMRCLELATVAGGLGTPMEPVGRPSARPRSVVPAEIRAPLHVTGLKATDGDLTVGSRVTRNGALAAPRSCSGLTF